MNTLTAPAPAAEFVTTARRVLPGDILLSEQGTPLVLVTRARTRLTGRRITQIEGEWLVQRPAGAPSIFRRSTVDTYSTYIRRAA